MAGCTPVDITGCVAQGLGDGLKALADSFAKSAYWAVKTMTTAWLSSPTPNVTSPGSAASWLSGRLSYFVMVAMFISVLYAAYRMATSGSFTHLAELGHSLLRLVIVSGSVALITSLSLEVGNAVADWVITTSPASISYVALLGAATTPPGVVLLVALVVILTQVVQFGLMLVKDAMVVALVAFIPLTAAATNTGVGKQGWQKAATWLAAFVLYKPVAAIIYALSFKLMDNSQTLTSQMSGIALMVLAVVALPALLRFLVPITASATGGNAGAIAGAAVGATLATGAVIASGGMAAGGFSGAAASAPSGASLASGALPAASAGASGVGDTTTSQTTEAVDAT